MSHALYRPLLLAGAVALGLTVTGCAGIGAEKKTETAPPRKAAETKEQNLYQRLGGASGLNALVDDFATNVQADKRVRRLFVSTKMPQFKAKLVEKLCDATGGPCKYTGPDPKEIYAKKRITKAQYDAVLENFVKSLNKNQVAEKEQQELLALLTPMEKDIVTPPKRKG